jgi:hypothetical protein
MVIFHAVQKLLNTSRLKPALYISKPSEGQMMHSWYAMLISTGFTGKLLVMYVHEPSLMVILCKGKTIQGTWEQFKERLPALMRRLNFPEPTITKEMLFLDEYVVSKTNSKAMLAFMNQMVVNLEIHSRSAATYEAIPLDWMEDIMMDYLYGGSYSNERYSTPLKYWEKIVKGIARR